jgi:hypothetical protein
MFDGVRTVLAAEFGETTYRRNDPLVDAPAQSGFPQLLRQSC